MTDSAHSTPNCPACRDVLLVRERERGVPFWGCPACGGAFFSVSDLGLYVERAGGDAKVSTAFWRLFQTAVREDVPSDGIRTCVGCERHLDRLGFGDYPFAILDRCAEHGVWLDRRDLPRVVRAARANATLTARMPRPEDLSLDKPEVEGAMVCPNCQGRFPGRDADDRCPSCNVPMFRA